MLQNLDYRVFLTRYLGAYVRTDVCSLSGPYGRMLTIRTYAKHTDVCSPHSDHTPRHRITIRYESSFIKFSIVFFENFKSLHQSVPVKPSWAEGSGKPSTFVACDESARSAATLSPLGESRGPRGAAGRELSYFLKISKVYTNQYR